MMLFISNGKEDNDNEKLLYQGINKHIDENKNEEIPETSFTKKINIRKLVYLIVENNTTPIDKNFFEFCDHRSKKNV